MLQFYKEKKEQTHANGINLRENKEKPKYDLNLA